MTVIGTNLVGLRTANAQTVAARAYETSVERLSTGKRINSAADDAAGLSVVSSLTLTIRGQSQAFRNVNDGISLLQAADGALGEVTNVLQRLRELSVQAASGIYSSTDRIIINTEASSLTAQLDNIGRNTTFNGIHLIGASDVTIDIQAGATAGEQISVTLKGLDLAGLASIDLSSSTGASSALNSLDATLDSVNTARASIGAGQNRLAAQASLLTSSTDNLGAARSGIEDVDFSKETTALAIADILSQGSTALLALANQSQQGLLKLLGG